MAGDGDKEWDARLDGRVGSSSVGNICHIARENCPVGALGSMGGKLTGDSDDGQMTHDGDNEWQMTPQALTVQRLMVD